MIVTYQLYFVGNYAFSSGCENGNACSNGRLCGAYPDDELCRLCSFEECLQHAEDNSVFAFSYRGTSTKWCRQCNEAQFGSQNSQNDWGVYVRGKYINYINKTMSSIIWYFYDIVNKIALILKNANVGIKTQ